MNIADNYKKIRQEIPEYVKIVLAAKTRTKEEIEEAINAGVTDIGENYVQEAENIFYSLGKQNQKVRWHMIGHLQKNKINKALQVLDTIQTVDSLQKAVDINKRAQRLGKKIAVYIEINIGSEISKSGIKPDYEIIKKLVCEMAKLNYLNLKGLMTMGPRSGDPEKSRPYFKKTKEIFDKINSLHISNVNMETLSMGMSNTYKVAIEEGSNMVRLGTIVFGKRCNV